MDILLLLVGLALFGIGAVAGGHESRDGFDRRRSLTRRTTMLPHHYVIALDLANQRIRELEREASRHRHLRDLPARARVPWHRSLRTLAARPVRAFSDATHAVSDAACAAARRIEGRAA